MTRNVRAVTFVAISTILAGLVATNYYVFFPLRTQIIDRELEHVDATVRNVARLTEGRVQIVELLLDNAIRVLAEDGISAQLAHETLRTSTDAVPLVRVLGVFDTDGSLRYSSRSVVPPQVNLANRDYVSHWLDGGSGERFLSGPVQNAVDGMWQISLSKPISRDGALWGVISAVINVDRLGISSHVSPDDEDFLTLMDRRFTLIDRYPPRPQDVGLGVGDRGLNRVLAASEAGTVQGTFVDPPTGETRIAVAHRFLDGKLVISSSRPLSSVLLYWRQLATVGAGMSGLIAALMLVLAAATLRDARLRREHARNLESLNAALENRTQEAERLAHVKSDFLATMSHEIRTPLTAIMGMHELSRRADNIEAIRRHLRVADGASRVLLAIINDILDSERLESGRLTLEEVPFALPDLIEQAVATVRAQAREKGLAVKLDLPEETEGRFVGDPMRLCQILINLLGNAVKFTGDGEIGLSVAVGAARGGKRQLRFEVTDTGPGIPADKLALLFQPFEQIQSWRARSSGGSGLGLSICKRLLDVMGGRIGVVSEEGRGSRFWFEIELAEFTPTAEVPAAAPAVAEASRPADVLVVDDNAINRDLIREMLASWGHRVVVADSGPAAIQRAAEQPFDVILLDIQMPEMDGIATILELRRQRLAGRARIIAVTANAMPEQLEEYSRAGFDGCVAKPIAWQKLRDEIDGVRGRHGDPAAAHDRTVVDWPLLAPVMAVMGEEQASTMLREAIEKALAMTRQISEELSDAALSEMTHAMRGFLGNLGMVAATRVLLSQAPETGRPDRRRLRTDLIAALHEARMEIDERLGARVRDLRELAS